MHKLAPIIRYKRWLSTSAIRPTRPLNGKYNWGKQSLISLDDNDFDASKLKRLTTDQLATYRSPPKGVKVLVRDFIHDALYNPHYGYFSRRAVIFSPPEPLNFQEIQNAFEFDAAVALAYAEISKAKGANTPTVGTQLWHTPVELFQVRCIKSC